MWSVLKKFLFALDPEKAHHLGMSAASLDIFRTNPPIDPRLRTKFLNSVLPHPLGLAAGFDKDGVALDSWENFGFSFIEAGTVTPAPQSGNEKPRLYRLPEDQALINRMGFNNRGVHELCNRLESRQTRVTIGANIGKNKTSEDAATDYAYCAKQINQLADYLTVNVSSPNTPGLRLLQASDELKRIIENVKLSNPNIPLFVKLSPDLNDDDLESAVQTSLYEGTAGLIATNTTINRDNLQSSNQSEEGGLSGKPLTKLSNDVCKKVRQIAGDKPTIIGVGGIMNGNDLYERLLSGANVCQIYSAFVYRGPHAVTEILSEYLERLNLESSLSLC